MMDTKENRPRKILHLDLDAFFCAVEELHNPALSGKPFAVGGRPEERGVVASCSYAARSHGIRSAMPMGRALRLCPNLQIVSSRHVEYEKASAQVMQRLNDLTPLVEQISIDEAFLDISDLPEPGEQIATNLQDRIRSELGLPCSLGVAANKLVAKIANDVGKSAAVAGRAGPPNAITVVPPGQEAAFLAPLPTERLWGVGPKTAARLQELGIHTIGDLAAFPPGALARLFGKNGEALGRHARGIDDSPLVTSHEMKSVSQETTFIHDIRDEVELKRTLRSLAEGAGRRLRQAGLVGATVKLKLRRSDFTTLTRQMTLPSATDQDAQIYAAALILFEKTWSPGSLVRLLGVGISGLGAQVRQLNLWEDTPQARHGRERELQMALDDLRKRFGSHVIQRASDLLEEEESG